jgi:uncharacterized protein DUF6010
MSATQTAAEPTREVAGWRSLSAGVLAGGTGALLGLCLKPRRRLDVGALELAFIAGAYPAFAFGGSSRRTVGIEFAAAGLFVGLGAVALSRRSRRAVAAGLLAHAAWDAVHHIGHPDTSSPSWFPSFCMAADIVLAAQFARGGES